MGEAREDYVMDSKPLGQQFAEDVESVIDKYAGQGLTVAEVIGYMDVIKTQVFMNQIWEVDDDDEEWKKGK